MRILRQNQFSLQKEKDEYDLENIKKGDTIKTIGAGVAGLGVSKLALNKLKDMDLTKPIISFRPLEDEEGEEWKQEKTEKPTRTLNEQMAEEKIKKERNKEWEKIKKEHSEAKKKLEKELDKKGSGKMEDILSGKSFEGVEKAQEAVDSVNKKAREYLKNRKPILEEDIKKEAKKISDRNKKIGVGLLTAGSLASIVGKSIKNGYKDEDR